MFPQYHIPRKKYQHIDQREARVTLRHMGRCHVGLIFSEITTRLRNGSANPTNLGAGFDLKRVGSKQTFVGDSIEFLVRVVGFVGVGDGRAAGSSLLDGGPVGLGVGDRFGSGKDGREGPPVGRPVGEVFAVVGRIYRETRPDHELARMRGLGSPAKKSLLPMHHKTSTGKVGGFS